MQSQVGFNRVPEKVEEKVPEKVWEGLVQSQVRFNWIRRRLRKNCKNETLRLLGIPPKLILLLALSSLLSSSSHDIQKCHTKALLWRVVVAYHAAAWRRCRWHPPRRPAAAAAWAGATGDRETGGGWG